MAQFVFEFGADTLEVTSDAMISFMGQPRSMEVVPAAEGNVLKYESANEPFATVADKLRTGALSSVIVRTDVPGIRYGLIMAPRFNGTDLSVWMGTIELATPDWKPLWTFLLSREGLRFVCLGSEEGVELTDTQLSIDTFPWTEWPLVIGALRADPAVSNQWFIRSREEELTSA